MTYAKVLSHFSAVILIFGLLALAPVDRGGFSITWSTVDGGGGVSSGGTYQLNGTIGQHDAGELLSSGDYSLVGGYWSVAGDVILTCFADLNGDLVVDVADLLELIAAWGACPVGCIADLNGDAFVDVADLLQLIAAWGVCA